MLNKNFILVLVFSILEIFSIVLAVNAWNQKKLYHYKTTAVIDDILLPDGDISVSCYDENHVLCKDVRISNKIIQGKFDYVKSFYGNEIQILLNDEKNKAIWLKYYYEVWIFPMILPLGYLIIMIISKKKSKISEN